MSTATLIPTADDGWDEFLEFAAIVDQYDRDDLPAPDPSLRRHEHRRPRSANERADIERSLRGDY